jgi:hypothetical protein
MDVCLVNITRLGEEVYHDEIATHSDFLAELKESLIELLSSLRQHFASQEDPSRAYDPARAAFEHRIDRLSRKGYKADHLRIAPNLVKVEHRQSTGRNFSSKWTVKYIESDQFEKHVDAALRFIETQIAELPTEADTTAYSGVSISNSVSPLELSS